MPAKSTDPTSHTGSGGDAKTPSRHNGETETATNTHTDAAHPTGTDTSKSDDLLGDIAQLGDSLSGAGLIGNAISNN